MAGVNDLDAERCGVDAGALAPSRLTGMPSAPRLGHQAVDGAGLVDEVVGAHPGSRVTESRERGLDAGHTGVVQDQHVHGRPGGARVVVGRRGVADSDHGPTLPAWADGAGAAR